MFILKGLEKGKNVTTSKTGSDLRMFFTLPKDLFRREHLEHIYFHIYISNIDRVSGDFREVTSQCFRLIILSVSVLDTRKYICYGITHKRAIM